MLIIRSPAIAALTLSLTLMLTGCGGPANLAYMRGCFFEGIGERHYATEDPISNEGIAEYRKAIDQFDTAIKFNPRFGDAYQQRGLCEWRCKQLNSALRDLSEAIALTPGNAILWKDRAWIYRDLEQFDKAVEDLDQAIKLNTSDAAGWMYRGQCEVRLGRVAEGFKDYERAQQLSPTMTEIYCQRAESYRFLGKYDKMAVEYAAARKLHPHDPDIYQWSGYSNFIIGDYDGALKDFQVVRHLTGLRHKSAPYTVILSVLALRLSNRKDEADELLDRSVSQLQLPLAASGTADAPVARSWPSPIIQYLHGDITAAKLLECAKNNRDRQTEVYCYLALTDKASGNTQSCHRYFQWIADHGTKNFVEYEIAIRQLADEKRAAQ